MVPKIEEDYLFDLSDDTLKEMMLFSKRVAKAMKQCIPCNRIGVSVVGLEVPHAHIHLIPIDGISDMSFERPKLHLDDEKDEGYSAFDIYQFCIVIGVQYLQKM